MLKIPVPNPSNYNGNVMQWWQQKKLVTMPQLFPLFVINGIRHKSVVQCQYNSGFPMFNAI